MYSDGYTLYSVWLGAPEIYSDKSSDCGLTGDSAVLMTVSGYLIASYLVGEELSSVPSPAL